MGGSVDRGRATFAKRWRGQGKGTNHEVKEVIDNA